MTTFLPSKREYRWLYITTVRELQQQLLRTANVWSHGHLNVPSHLEPNDFEEREFLFRWFEGQQLPSSISPVTVNEERSSNILVGEKLTIIISISILFLSVSFYIFPDGARDIDQDYINCSDEEIDSEESQNPRKGLTLCLFHF